MGRARPRPPRTFPPGRRPRPSAAPRANQRRGEGPDPAQPPPGYPPRAAPPLPRRSSQWAPGGSPAGPALPPCRTRPHPSGSRPSRCRPRSRSRHGVRRLPGLPRRLRRLRPHPQGARAAGRDRAVRADPGLLWGLPLPRLRGGRRLRPRLRRRLPPPLRAGGPAARARHPLGLERLPPLPRGLPALPHHLPHRHHRAPRRPRRRRGGLWAPDRDPVGIRRIHHPAHAAGPPRGPRVPGGSLTPPPALSYWGAGRGPGRLGPSRRQLLKCLVPLLPL